MTNSETSGVELPDMDLLKKFDVPAPRYTSYPTADRFNAEFTAEDYARAAAMVARHNLVAAAVKAHIVAERHMHIK